MSHTFRPMDDGTPSLPLSDRSPAGANPTRRDVFVSSRARHTPAHRVKNVADDGPTRWPITTGCGWERDHTQGEVITRLDAATLLVFPCGRCFALPTVPNGTKPSS